MLQHFSFRLLFYHGTLSPLNKRPDREYYKVPPKVPKMTVYWPTNIYPPLVNPEISGRTAGFVRSKRFGNGYSQVSADFASANNTEETLQLSFYAEQARAGATFDDIIVLINSGRFSEDYQFLIPGRRIKRWLIDPSYTQSYKGRGNWTVSISIREFPAGQTGSAVYLPPLTSTGGSVAAGGGSGGGSGTTLLNTIAPAVWRNVAGTANLSANDAVMIQGSARTTLNLPATAAYGDPIWLHSSVAPFDLVPGTGQSIRFGNQTTVAGGKLYSTAIGPNPGGGEMILVCSSPSTTWDVLYPAPDFTLQFDP